ncbi:hypothetical protein AB0K16_54005 [Nonomuraea jabiensis]|uniref:hypothetical protein n=1 Tax=Nonomuraea jabiensis TaxID=882448 RepID=UPI00342BEAB8
MTRATIAPATDPNRAVSASARFPATVPVPAGTLREVLAGVGAAVDAVGGGFTMRWEAASRCGGRRLHDAVGGGFTMRYATVVVTAARQS